MNLQEQLELARGTNEKLRIKIQQMKGALRRHKNTTPVYTSKVPLKQGTDECIEEFLLTTRKVYTEGLIQNFPVLQDFIVVSVRNLLRPPNGKRYDSNSGLYLRMMLCLKNMGCANGVDFICRNMNGPSNRTIDRRRNHQRKMLWGPQISGNFSGITPYMVSHDEMAITSRVSLIQHGNRDYLIGYSMTSGEPDYALKEVTSLQDIFELDKDPKPQLGTKILSCIINGLNPDESCPTEICKVVTDSKFDRGYILGLYTEFIKISAVQKIPIIYFTSDGDPRNRSAALSICSWETINNFSDREYRDKYGTIFNSIQ
eukprot:TRINITY_DN622_c0_g1_i4.p1 TRINITY_DN622_c0_g1~~TRINITY_DN622_c0_g1_i4.p1  ORF type:complete len:315 (+),score=49.19 TRINITY_DN622_c0_g1_i4:838-1782(+)